MQAFIYFTFLILIIIRVTAATLSPFAEQLIKSLFGILTKPGSEENSHTMKGKNQPHLFPIYELYSVIINYV